MTPSVSVIIPLKEINDYLRSETVPSILKQSNSDFEIIILPDRNTKESFPKTTIVATYPKIGPADKRDLGVQKAKGKILAFLDDDSYPDKNWLKNALTIFGERDSDSIAGVCGPAITPPNDSLRQKVSGAVWSSWIGSGGAGTYRCSIAPRREVDDYPSVNLLVRKKDFLQVGGFDSHFWPGEDTKLCLDLTKRLGKRLIYDPKVLVYHHRREVFGPHLAQISRYAVHRGHFARILPSTSFRLGYFAPTVFVIGLIGGPVLGAILMLSNFQSFTKPVFTFYLLMISLYVLILLWTASQCFLKEKSLSLALLLIPSVFMTHFIYGVLFLKGFLSSRLAR